MGGNFNTDKVNNETVESNRAESESERENESESEKEELVNYRIYKQCDNVSALLSFPTTTVMNTNNVLQCDDHCSGHS